MVGPAHVKPLLLGYVHLPMDASAGVLTQKRECLASYARIEGFTLVEVFADMSPDRPLSAFAAVIEAAKVLDVAAVAISEPADLGREDFVRGAMRQRLQRETGVRVLTASRSSPAAQANPQERQEPCAASPDLTVTSPGR